ncbi:hypothetical protein RIF29_29954 [Crotalaria pallida]|uniref:SBP-type domain-containing protein n=1 Tax=Crotalaria pallida TaxID=3830 RepID=A0AAN9EMA7_CROPI
MDFGGNMFCLGNRDQNGNNNSYGWDSWEITTSTSSKLINAFHTTEAAENSSAAAVNGHHEAGLANALMFLPHHPNNHNDGVINHHHRHYQSYPYGGDGLHSHIHVDPHLMCLKLGKRHYFEDPSGAPQSSGLGLADKRGKGYCGGSGDGGAKAAVARCQVEGCHVALVNVKDYHRRHKVCEMHSKAPKVVVLGLEQRFCQQCSRFHVVSEFDDSKRSCRRRLAGHNERRRKNSHDSVGRNTLEAGYAPSLLSSRSRNNSWLSPADLSTRCSAALRELIAENRAAIMARQLSDRDWHLHHHAVEDVKVMIQPESNYFPQQMFHPTQ